MANKQNRRKRSNRPNARRRLAWLMLLLLIPLTGVVIWMSIPKEQNVAKGFQFTKEGELRFVRAPTDTVLAAIDIEVAADDLEIQRGLMWRREMEDNQGMLFLMETAEPQSFWMLNTYLSLDIIFVDEQKRILNIAQNTRPESLNAIRSAGDARYVIEVLAGFAERNGIKPGDEVRFEVE